MRRIKPVFLIENKSILMRNLEMIPSLLLLLTLIACKKEKVTSETQTEPFDITSYVLVEKGLGLADDDHIITTFELQGKAIWYTSLGFLSGPTYNYADGVLKIYQGATVHGEFKIENQKIISYSNKNKPYSCQLIKIPKGNQLNGNTYSGSWKNQGSLLFQPSTFKFTDTHFAEASFNLPVPNNQYTSIKNIGASIYINNVRTLLIMIDEKIYGTRNYPNGTVAIGEFSKQ